MFIYEFMSGVVETITGTDEEDFEPHRHRKVEKPTTYSETMIHLLKGSIGAGVLAMPSAVYRVGIIASIIGLLIVGAFATYCIQLLIAAQYELCKRWRRGYIAYPKSMLFALRDGPKSLRWSANSLYYFVNIVLVMWQLGICVIYFVFVAENIKQVLALEYNMEEPKHFVGLFGLFNLGMFIIITLYIVIGVFGYLKYGDTIEATITLNLPQEEKKAQAAKIIFALAIFLTFPLQNYVAYSMVWRKLQKRIPENRRLLPDYALRVALVLIPWILAVSVPHLGPFISLFGAFCLSLLAMVFPGLMDLCLWYPDRYGLCHYKLIRDIFIILIGMACLMAGCYTSMMEIIEA